MSPLEDRGDRSWKKSTRRQRKVPRQFNCITGPTGSGLVQYMFCDTRYSCDATAAVRHKVRLPQWVKSAVRKIVRHLPVCPEKPTIAEPDRAWLSGQKAKSHKGCNNSML